MTTATVTEHGIVAPRPRPGCTATLLYLVDREHHANDRWLDPYDRETTLDECHHCGTVLA